MHIEKVMDGIRENTTRVWNTKAYLMAALFNSVSTIDNHYTISNTSSGKALSSSLNSHQCIWLSVRSRWYASRKAA